VKGLSPELIAKALELAGQPQAPPKKKKYRNVPTVVDGVRYDSAKEARHAQLLQAMLRDGLIRNLRRQVTYLLEVNGVLICRYKPDFVFEELSPPTEGMGWWTVVQDVKGYLTPEYKLKKKLMLACHGIDIQEI
jgi:hypothetical protein